MPYIEQKDRAHYVSLVESIADLVPDDRTQRPGHLNFIISLLLAKVFGDRLRYADHNEVMGILTSVQLEFYRRRTSPYEDEKIEENGDL